jgi:hypothetical protein
MVQVLSTREVAMKVFVVSHENRPGEIARYSGILAAGGINIASTASLAFGDRGATGFIMNDEPGGRAVLDEAGLTYAEYDVVQVRLLDQPGTLAAASQRLADAGINIEFLAPTTLGSGDQVTLAIGVRDAQAARQALNDIVINDR